MLQLPVSRGYLAKLCTGTISASLAEADDELTAAFPRQEHSGATRRAAKTTAKALDLVHHGGHLQRFSHRRLALAGGVGKVGGAGVPRLIELRLFLGQLLVCLELLNQGAVLLVSFDT